MDYTLGENEAYTTRVITNGRQWKEHNYFAAATIPRYAKAIGQCSPAEDETNTCKAGTGPKANIFIIGTLLDLAFSIIPPPPCEIFQSL